MRQPETIDDFVVRANLVGREIVVDGDCGLVGQSGPLPIERQALSTLAAVSRQLLLNGGQEAASAVALGRKIFDTALPGQVGELLRAALHAAASKHLGIRIQLRLAQLADLQDLAWELLHDGARFLSMVPSVSVVRYPVLTKAVTSPRANSPIRVLFTTAQPAGCQTLDLDAEERQMRLALQPLGEWLHLTVERHLSLARLRHLLLRAEDQQRPFTVWHHGGHGGLVTKARDEPAFALLLEEHSGQNLVSGTALAAAAANCPNLQMVVLNVCHGAEPAGLAPALARLNVPVVIGFRTTILDQAALAFASAFYRGLVHHPAEIAMGEARLALAYEGSRPLNWALPLLFSRSSRPARLLS